MLVDVELSVDVLLNAVLVHYKFPCRDIYKREAGDVTPASPLTDVARAIRIRNPQDLSRRCKT